MQSVSKSATLQQSTVLHQCSESYSQDPLWYLLVLPDPISEFLHPGSRILDPGVNLTPDPGSGSANWKQSKYRGILTQKLLLRSQKYYLRSGQIFYILGSKSLVPYLRIPFPVQNPLHCLKGQYHKILDFWFFSWISFPRAPDYTIRAVSNLFENSRRYTQLKVHHRCCWKKSSIRKILIILLGHLWIVELTYLYIFAFKFTLRYLQPDIVPITNLPPVSMIPVAICPRVVETGGKFATGVCDAHRTFCCFELCSIS